MADVVINIEVSSVQYTAWLRTSYNSLAEVSGDGTPMVEQLELGPDQEDAFKNFMDEAAREVAKLFSSRQGDAAGTPFEYDGTNAIYRFNENSPVLTQADSLKSQINEDTKNALFSFVSILWYNSKGQDTLKAYYMAKYNGHSSSIEKNLYLLHD